jgi:hypothetical protein
MIKHIRRSFHFAILILSTITSQTAFSGVHISLGGSHSESNAGYQKIVSGAGSAGLSFDIGGYTRLGYTFRQETDATTGYQLNSAGTNYVYFRKNATVTSNSVDLTLILYAGDIFTPFVFAGVVKKQYSTHIQDATGSVESYAYPYAGPQGGAGLGVRLSQKFSLKTTYTMSNGYTVIPGQELQQTVDSYTQVGITYEL